MGELFAALFLLAQDAPRTLYAPGTISGEEMLLYACSLFGSIVFVATGYSLFSVGWESYEEKYIEGAERTLEDLFITIPPQHLLWLTVFSFFFMFAIGLLVLENLIFGIMLALFGAFFPSWLLKFMLKRRAEKFKEQLVDALITLTNALRSGFSLPKAFNLISHDMPKPICQEFSILVQELRLGIDTEEGLRNMLKRMPSEDLDLVVTSVAISNSVGGNLAEVFDKIGDTIRERRRIEGRIDALTSQGRAQGIVLSSMPFFLLAAINYIAPDLAAAFWTTWYGWILLGIMGIMEVLGYLLIRKIVNIEV